MNRRSGNFAIIIHARDLQTGTVSDASNPPTLAREIRSLSEASANHPQATLQLILLENLPAPPAIPSNMEILPAVQWFLEAPGN